MSKLKFEDLILFENDNYIVVNKPPFVSSLEDRNENLNMLAMAKDYYAEAQLGHRLDKETSGALAIAKNPEAYRQLSMQFENRSVTKEYHTVVDGIHEYKNRLVDAPILTLGRGKVKIDHFAGKASATTINTMRAFRLHTLLSCFPETGRMHQIRIHLAHIKAHIVGDVSYGGKPFYLSSIKKHYHLKKGTEELPLIKRIALHAFRLSFLDVGGGQLNIEAPYPKDFAVLIKQLEKNS